MKRTATTFLFFIIITYSFAQNISSAEILVRQDTTELKAADCKWIITALQIKYEVSEKGMDKSIPHIIFEAIENNKLKAVDPVTGNFIPAKEINTWQLAFDTVATIDADGNHKYSLVQRKRNPDYFSLVRIYHDWVFNITSGKFKNVIRYIELLESIYTITSGIFIGYKPFCRIYY